jgi:hypothetical protein
MGNMVMMMMMLKECCVLPRAEAIVKQLEGRIRLVDGLGKLMNMLYVHPHVHL